MGEPCPAPLRVAMRSPLPFPCVPDRPYKILLAQVGTLSFSHPLFVGFLFIYLCIPVISGANSLVVLRTLHSATGGASEWRPPLVWCREVPLRRAPVTTGGRLNSPSGAGLDPGTLCDSCACRRVTTPGPAAGRTTSRPARTRRRWTTSAAQGLALPSPPRARCSRSTCRTATTCRSCRFSGLCDRPPFIG